MARNLSPVLCKQLADLDKDSDSRKSAMKALESYVKEMDSKCIPLFLSQLVEIRETGSLSEEYTVSLYEVLARAHGVDIVPHVDSIMEVIVRMLASSGGSFHLQQSCSKVIPALSRYCIDPTMAEDRKRHIIHSLCNPLCESLLGSQESLSAGAALCLKALVDSDNWRFASDAMVNKVSLNVAVALEVKSNQTNPHMGLVMALTKKNSLIVEAYSRLLIGSGLRILNAGEKECNSQKRLSAIQMVNFLMKSLDPRSLYSELDLIIEEMQKYESDQMAFVKGAAFEALQTAKGIAAEKEWKLEKGSTPRSNSSNVNQDSAQVRNFLGFGNQSPESHTLHSFSQCDSALEPPNSPAQVYSDLESNNRIVKLRVRIFENGVVDVPLKDGFFLGAEHSRSQELDDNGGKNSDAVTGFVQESASNGANLRVMIPSPRSQEMDDNGSDSSSKSEQESAADGADSQSLIPSPQMPPAKFYIGNTHMFTTSRKVDHSLQSTSLSNSGSSMEKQVGMFSSSPSSKSDGSETGSNDFNEFLADHDGGLGEKESGKLDSAIQQIQVGSEPVSSTDAAPANIGGLAHQLVIREDRERMQRFGKTTQKRSFLVICSVLFLLLALITSLMWIDNNPELGRAVPT